MVNGDGGLIDSPVPLMVDLRTSVQDGLDQGAHYEQDV